MTPFPRRILAGEPLGTRGSILDPPNGINIIYLEAGTEIDPLYLMYHSGHGPPIIDPRLLIHRDTPKGNKSVVVKAVCTTCPKPILNGNLLLSESDRSGFRSGLAASDRAVSPHCEVGGRAWGANLKYHSLLSDSDRRRLLLKIRFGRQNKSEGAPPTPKHQAGFPDCLIQGVL